MKRLIIVRHGKAEEIFKESDDFQRHLTSKGIKDSLKVARKIKFMYLNPDLLISSPANRALETAQNFAEELSYPVENIELFDSLYYYFNNEKLFKYIKNIDNKHKTIIIFGHNPYLSLFVNTLLSGNNISLHTSGAVGISFPTESWGKIAESKGKMIFYEIP